MKKIISYQKCITCQELVMYEKELSIEETAMGEAGKYLSIISRGGLKKPKPEVVHIFIEVLKLFKCIIDRHEDSFLKVKSQKKVLTTLSLEILQESSVLCSTKCSTCEIPHLVIVKKCVSIFGNILLNNYSKNIRDKLYNDKKDKRRVKKLSSQ